MGNLNLFEKFFSKHLPRFGKILEAGCGMAQLVVALNARGYNCFGFDYTLQALRRVNSIVGKQPLICGDITAMGLAESSCAAVISLGVVEHRIGGPEPFLKEMLRVLQPNGVMMISVPCFNPLRRWRASHGAYQDSVTGLEFYQYAFTPDEFCSILEQAGFDVERTYTYAQQNTLTQELHWLRKFSVSHKALILRISKYIPIVNSKWGHMLMVVARKRRAPSV